MFIRLGFFIFFSVRIIYFMKGWSSFQPFLLIITRGANNCIVTAHPEVICQQFNHFINQRMASYTLSVKSYINKLQVNFFLDRFSLTVTITL